LFEFASAHCQSTPPHTTRVFVRQRIWLGLACVMGVFVAGIKPTRPAQLGREQGGGAQARKRQHIQRLLGSAQGAEIKYRLP
jgi:hypothetical protein